MLRVTFAATALAVALVPFQPPAHALGEPVVLTGGLTFRPGTGTGNGTATFWAVGARTGEVTGTFTFWVNRALCPLVDSAVMTLSGAINGKLTLARMGPALYASTDSWQTDYQGAGYGVELYTEPNNPIEYCVNPDLVLHATVVISLSSWTVP